MRSANEVQFCAYLHLHQKEGPTAVTFKLLPYLQLYGKEGREEILSCISSKYSHTRHLVSFSAGLLG